MSRFLTQLLASVVPEVHVKSARVSRRGWYSYKVGGELSEYYILVEPCHKDYWGHFHIRYPHCKQLARAHGAEELDLDLGHRCCPEFYTKEDLVSWLADTLGLSQGERKLLRLSLL